MEFASDFFEKEVREGLEGTRDDEACLGGTDGSTAGSGRYL